MRLIVYILFFFSISIGFSQNPAGFDQMVDTNVKGTVPLISIATLKKRLKENPDLVLLDCREKNEYVVSHLPRAIYGGYDHFQLNSISQLDKNTEICVYCSIGVRSEKIGEQLVKAGFKNVVNLEGGIFSWANQGNTVLNAKGKSTSKVHGYDLNWSKYLNTERCEVILK